MDAGRDVPDQQPACRVMHHRHGHAWCHTARPQHGAPPLAPRLVACKQLRCSVSPAQVRRILQLPRPFERRHAMFRVAVRLIDRSMSCSDLYLPRQRWRACGRACAGPSTTPSRSSSRLWRPCCPARRRRPRLRRSPGSRQSSSRPRGTTTSSCRASARPRARSGGKSGSGADTARVQLRSTPEFVSSAVSPSASWPPAARRGIVSQAGQRDIVNGLTLDSRL